MTDIHARLEKTDHFFVQLWIEQGEGVDDGCGQPQTDTVVALSFKEAKNLAEAITKCLKPFLIKEN